MPDLIREKTKNSVCFYCKTTTNNATTQKDLKVCCCYCLQNRNGVVTQHYHSEEDMKKDGNNYV